MMPVSEGGCTTEACSQECRRAPLACLLYNQGMKRLWAPWRIAYIREIEKIEGCIFCVKPQENRDDENFLLYRGKTAFVLLNIFPYNSGHLMVAPYRHTALLEDLSPEEARELWHLVTVAVQALKRTFQPDGFNVGLNLGRAAGAGFDQHLHVHIVPRWVGDTNFMPVIGDTKVIPEGLEETYRRLKPVFEELVHGR